MTFGWFYSERTSRRIEGKISDIVPCVIFVFLEPLAGWEVLDYFSQTHVIITVFKKSRKSSVHKERPESVWPQCSRTRLEPGVQNLGFPPDQLHHQVENWFAKILYLLKPNRNPCCSGLWFHIICVFTGCSRSWQWRVNCANFPGGTSRRDFGGFSKVPIYRLFMTFFLLCVFVKAARDVLALNWPFLSLRFF